MIRGILLDVDGTLVLSNESHTEAWLEAFNAFGYTVDHDKVRGLLGMGADQLLPRIVPGLSKDENPGKEIADTRKKIFLEKYAPALKPAPGARRFVQRLKDEGLTVVIASSANTQELEVLLKVADVEDLIDLQTTSDEADSSKPEPDIVEAAMKKAHMSPADVVMIGDTPFDIESAGKAGVGVIALRCGGFSDDTFGGSLAVYDDPGDLVVHYEESPLAHMTRN
ncbi:MAG: HAD family hydrolase [Chloroflexota bacterium]